MERQGFSERDLWPYPFKDVRYLTEQKEMTLILGSKCTDGIVMVGDRKLSVSDRSTSDYVSKISEDVTGVVWGAAGKVSYYNSFKERVKNRLREQDIPANHFLELIEEVHAELIRQYDWRYLNQFAIMISPKITDKAGLFLVAGEGGHTVIRTYEAFGSGRPYATLFLKKLWKPELTMMQVAELGSFIIKLIERTKLDETVGVGDLEPQVWLLPNGEAIREAEEAEIKSISEKAEVILNKQDEGFEMLEKLIHS